MNKIIMHIVGNRPQFIKLAPLSHELRKRGFSDIIIHTGQHYDQNMSDIFFSELGIEKPYQNLNIGSGSHAEVTARALIGIEKILLEINPAVVILYGDTNSTLAAALAASKLNIPIVHVEAGPRTLDKNNPEECNRIITDHMSDILCCPDRRSVENLQNEGIHDGVYFTGDIMYDTFLFASRRNDIKLLSELKVKHKDYILMTWHRQENTESKARMGQIVAFLKKVKNNIIFPIHPRTKMKLKEFGLFEELQTADNIKIIEPIGYFDMVTLMNHCKFILTDSGGLSKESFFAGVKCFFMLDLDVWSDLLEIGWIQKLDFDCEDNLKGCLAMLNSIDDNCVKEKLINDFDLDNGKDRQMGVNRGNEADDYYGNGKTASLIVDILERKKLI